jgi:CNT family concentrative nucleoside transporter
LSDLPARAVSLLGLAALIGLAWLASIDRRRVPWRTVGWGVGLQLLLGALLLRTPAGAVFFRGMDAVVMSLDAWTGAGVRFVFGALADTGFSFAIHVLPIIIFMGSVFAVLYHVGLMQRVVDLLAWLLSRTLRTSGAEGLAAGANLFLGMTESALVVRPYLERMTRSELFSLMTLGMATVAGSVLVAYAGMLGPGYAGHLATASLLSLPAGLLVAKVMVPETDTPATAAAGGASVERAAVNLFDAAAQGAVAGLRLAAYVGAMLIAFVALIALVNDGIGAVGGLVGAPDLTLEAILGALLAPVAWLMGVAWQDAAQVGSLLGVKTVLNEFIAYQELGRLIETGALQPRSARIASYALCGFANFGSLAILLGGIGGLAPSRRDEVARFGMRCIVSGTLASFMTACVVGMLG